MKWSFYKPVLNGDLSRKVADLSVALSQAIGRMVRQKLFEGRKDVNEKVKSTAAFAVTYFPLLRVQIRMVDKRNYIWPKKEQKQ